MKFLSTYRPTVPAVATQETARARAEQPPQPQGQPQPAALACRGTPTSPFSTNPAELYVSLTMTKIEHLEALMETLQTYAPQLEHARRRNEED